MPQQQKLISNFSNTQMQIVSSNLLVSNIIAIEFDAFASSVHKQIKTLLKGCHAD